MRSTKVKTVIQAIPAIAMAAVLTACSSQAHASGLSSAAGGGSPTTTVSSKASVPSTTTSAAPTTTTHTTPAPVAPQAAPSAAPAVHPAAAVPQAPVVSNPCGISNGACVVLSARKAWIVRNGQVIYGAVPIMPGSPSYPTPTGTFHVLYQQVMHISTEFHNAPMPYSTFFYPGDAFHVGSLGVYSHGCIHMSSTGAKTFFRDLNTGDEVKILA